jgi:hypothetical protein
MDKISISENINIFKEKKLMKKGLSALFFVLVTMAVLVTNVLAAPVQANRKATLQRVTYEKSGITLLFHTSGLSKGDLKNKSFTAHSRQWDMTCNLVGGTTNVRCQVSKKLSMFSGEGFHGTLAGFYFAGKLPSARVFPKPAVTQTAAVTEAPTACSDGQTLSYTFEYSNSSYQAEVWSDYYIDQDTFHSLYNVYPESTSTYTDSYLSDSVYDTKTYYIYSYTTTTIGYGATPSENWVALVSAYESNGFTIQQTGQSCGFSL